MKKCPYCAEEIQDEAVKCKHCFEFLDETKRPLPPSLPAAAGNSLSQRPAPTYNEQNNIFYASEEQMSNLAQRAIRDNGFAVTNVGPKFVAFETGMTWGSWSGATCSISIEEIEMNCFAAHGSGKQNIRGAQLIAVDFGEAKGKVGKVIDRMKVLGGHIPQPLAWYFKTSFIVLMFLTLPPFALPSVWLHPKLHVVWKLLITAAVLGFCWLSYVAFTGFVKQFDEATKMLNDFKM